MNMRHLSTVESPAGPLHIAVTESGTLTSVWFSATTSIPQIEELLRRAGIPFAWECEPGGPVVQQLKEYSSGRRTTFDLDLEMTGSEWEKQVWDALLTIPYGETRSYGQIATPLGDPNKARAVGWANAANPIPVIVPCHRVIGAQGNLTGFGGGIEAKIKLLTHEGAMLPGFA